MGKYSAKMYITGSIIEVYEYEIPVDTEFNGTGGRGGSRELSDDERLDNRERAMQNARKELRRIVNTNLTSQSKFMTLTFAENVKDLQQAQYEFKKFRQRLEDTLKVKLQYTGVREFQKRGAVHFHVIFYNLPYIKAKRLQTIWGNGFVKINRIDRLDCPVGSYISKYIGKHSLDERMEGQKSYFNSRGIQKPLEITDLQEFVILQKSCLSDAGNENGALRPISGLPSHFIINFYIYNIYAR